MTAHGARLRQAEAAGALVVFCTARPHRWMRPLAQETGHHGVAICANGAVVFDLHTESVVEATPLEPAIARELVALLREEVPGGAWAVERTGGFGHEPGYVPRWPVPAETTVDVVEALVAQPVVKLMLRHDRLLGRRAGVGARARSAATWRSSATRTLPTGCSRSAPPGSARPRRSPGCASSAGSTAET